MPPLIVPTIGPIRRIRPIGRILFVFLVANLVILYAALTSGQRLPAGRSLRLRVFAF